MLGWNIGTELLIIPHENRKYGSGFIVTAKKTTKISNYNVEANIALFLDFVKQIGNEINPNDLKNLIEQDKHLTDSLPEDLVIWFGNVLH